MALVVKDRVKETSTTTGTGTFTLAGASAGFQSFSVIGDGNTTYYTITDGTDWEVGIGTYTSSGTTLSRDTILESSNSGSAVNWGAGSKDVFVTYPAEKAVYFNASDAVDVDNLRLDGNTISSTDTNGNIVLAPNGTGRVEVSGTSSNAGGINFYEDTDNGTNKVLLTAPAALGSDITVTLPDITSTIGFRNIPPVGTKTGSYTLATSDVGEYVQVGSGGSITIPDATFAEGDAISIFNNTSGNITITCTITTAYIAGTDSDKASVTLATRGVATILFISGTVCVITGNVS